MIEMANKFCTCGAQLVDNALFCHRCGKAQRELMAVPPAEELTPLPVAAGAGAATPPSPPPLPASVTIVAINLRNRQAVQIAAAVAAFFLMLVMLPLPGPLQVLQSIWQIVVLSAAGFLSVYLYHRRSGQEVSIGNGARLGWLTGLFLFLLVLMIFTLTVVLALAMDLNLRDLFDSATKNGVGMERVRELLDQPGGLTSLIVFSLIAAFVLFGVFSTVGGALGAKVLSRDEK